MRLSKRLELVASFVPEGSRLADVGTDHGYIPIALAERNVICRAVAMDLRPGPLERAKAHICQAGLEEQIETRLSDGLKMLTPGEADTVIIAGMGGELVIHILEEGRHMWKDISRFILSPQSDLDKVRRYLEQSGFAIGKEAMVEEEGKFYTVMEAAWRECPKSGSAGEEGKKSWYAYGKHLIENKDPVLVSFLAKEEKRVTKVLSRLNHEETPSESVKQAILQLGQELTIIKEAQEEMGLR